MYAKSPVSSLSLRNHLVLSPLQSQHVLSLFLVCSYPFKLHANRETLIVSLLLIL